MAASWICCNNCFAPPSANSKLAVSTCGHIICSGCFQHGNIKEGECRICKAKCQLSLISDKSSPEVKALFSDHSPTVTTYLAEISKVLLFQARHQKRLLTHYQQRNEKLEDVLLKMKQEIQELNTKISQQNSYIFKLENSVHQRTGNAEADTIPLFCKTEIPGSMPRLSMISPPQAGRIGTVSHRVSNHAARSASVSREFSCSLKDGLMNQPQTLKNPRDASWETPVFKAPYRYSSLSSLHSVT
ncbi:probable E3 SUMO-protein ligase RNF212 [Sardina pilchardus]|uniref:probable E3 SUMO-protein ligase RNF212 n=1 Tax=Sardina pilchardus TaxID=27697 RepID=UPI002E12CA44